MNIYNKLKKIKSPVLIEVEKLYDNIYLLNCYRILYPNGYCETTIDFLTFDNFNDIFNKSCFINTYFNLNNTIEEMKNHDFYLDLKITKIQAI